MDDWTDGSFGPDDDATGGNPAVDNAPENAATGGEASGGAVSDGLPGEPVPGYPDLRVGVPGGAGVLGLYRVGDDQSNASRPPWPDSARIDDLVARPGTQGQAPGGALLMPLSGAAAGDPSKVLGDYETNSWRWNNLDALNYDLQDKQRQLNEALALGQASNRAGYGETAAAVGAGLSKGLSLGELLSAWPLAAATSGINALMSESEIPRLQSSVEAIQNRIRQLKGRPT